MYCIFETSGFPDIKFPAKLAILTIQEFDILLCNFGYRLSDETVKPLFKCGTEQDYGVYVKEDSKVRACILPDDWIKKIPPRAWSIVISRKYGGFEFMAASSDVDSSDLECSINFRHLMNPTQSLISLGYDYLEGAN